jgi:hypothetical protein
MAMGEEEEDSDEGEDIDDANRHWDTFEVCIFCFFNFFRF